MRPYRLPRPLLYYCQPRLSIGKIQISAKLDPGWTTGSRATDFNLPWSPQKEIKGAPAPRRHGIRNCHSATFCRQTNRMRFVILQPNESRFVAALSPTHAETGRQTIRPTFQFPGRNVQPLPGAFIRSYIMIAAAMAALSDSAPPRIGSFRCKSAHANTSEEMPRASLPITSTKRSPTGGRA